MPVHVECAKRTFNVLECAKRTFNVLECAKRTFNVLALSTQNCHVFSLGHRYSNTSSFFIFIDRKLSLRTYTADIISL